ncbi:MAG: rhomboid family intramembrane serine protease [Polaribacter sp.]|nr:rhomboid family intramembrane serine protease [Polaribacter sp.]MDC1373832.1 rhomboid family intramembrane serine protease [Polaribacter sp.]MDG1321375.1 rhomboid family intramembrane serine protease [Polaribacter sp.]
MNQVILFIIIVNVITSMKGFKDYSFINSYKFQVNRILAGEKIRMLTSGFLHVDWTHLGFNMYALYLFGAIVTNGMGTLSFVIIYLGSLLTGSLYSLLFHKKEPYYSAVGASGAVSGILFSGIILAPNKLYNFIFFPFVDIPGYILGVGYLLYSIYGMKKQLGNVGHAAHLGGAMGGFVLTLILKPEVFVTHTFVVALLAIPIILLLLFGDKLKNL